MALARAGKLMEVADESFFFFVHPDRHGDVALRALVRAMAEETGAEAFLRQQQAIIGRPDSRPTLGAIMCPTLMLVGEQDQGTPPKFAREIAAGIAGARLVIFPTAAICRRSSVHRPSPRRWSSGCRRKPLFRVRQRGLLFRKPASAADHVRAGFSALYSSGGAPSPHHCHCR
jgi:hypothetical protein